MTKKMTTTYFQAVDIGTTFHWGSIDPVFRKVDHESAVRVSNDPKYIGKMYAFAPMCSVKYRPLMHITREGQFNLCGSPSRWAAHIHYASRDAEFDDGDWCPTCRGIQQEQYDKFLENEARPPYSIGQRVQVMNGYGIDIGEKTVIGIASDGTYFLDPTDTPWYSWRQGRLTPIE
jgi:hypothetical protein